MLSVLQIFIIKQILHRDMKASNILITKSGILKLADFGLARPFSIAKPDTPNSYTNRVVTLWYRAPELLLGDRNYGPAIDMWGAGCIMAEMWTRCAIMQGSTETQQLVFISQLCGSITPDVWPGVTELNLYNELEMPMGHERKVKNRLQVYVKDADGCDLLDKLLVIDPTKRIDADTALDHNFFWTEPMPADLSKMLSDHSQSMFEYLQGPRYFQQRIKDTALVKQTASKGKEEGFKDRIY